MRATDASTSVDARQAFRDRTIARIARRWDENAREGIYGGEVCQICGEFGTFFGRKR